MRISTLVLAAALAAIGVCDAVAEEEFVPETVTVEKTIRPGPNLFVLDQSWKGVSRINVLSADDLSRKGILSVGLVGQFTLSADRKTAYTTSAYARRIVSGTTEAVLQEFDVETLSQKREIPISEKMAQVAPFKSMLRLSADEKYIFIQNATPATSVTVVDLAAGKAIAEVPTPGCWSLYPAASGVKFTTLCGDGTLTSFTVAPDGSFSAPMKSEKIFDADKEPFFTHGERAGGDLVFSSFHGRLYRVSDADGAPKLLDSFSYTDGIEGGWAPGGVEVMAYNAAHDVMFVAMHPEAKEGSHKAYATEVWAVDLKAKKTLYRSVVHGVKSIAVTSGETPILFGLDDENGVATRYEVDPEAKFAAKLAGTLEDVGLFTALAVAGE